MKLQFNLTLLAISIVLLACNNKVYRTNGETIYMTGRNLDGDKMINRKASSIPVVSSCRNCHGKKGNRMKNVSIQWSNLSHAADTTILHMQMTVPYTDSLFYRFIDDDIKSDGTKANIGVIWKMSDKDKKDLLEYLKTL